MAAITAAAIHAGIETPQCLANLLQHLATDLNLCVGELVFEDHFRFSAFDANSVLAARIGAGGTQIVVNLV